MRKLKPEHMRDAIGVVFAISVAASAFGQVHPAGGLALLVVYITVVNVVFRMKIKRVDRNIDDFIGVAR